MKKHFITTIGLLPVFLILFSSCGNINSALPETGTEENLPEDIVELRADQKELAGIQTGPIETKSLSSILKVNGKVTVAPQNLATVCAPMGGFVKSTSQMPGNYVTKGQSLALLENQDFIDLQQNYLEARNKLEFAEADYKRHSKLYKEDVYSQKNLQQVTADYKNLMAEVKAYGEKLAMIGIDPTILQESNISGTVALFSPINGYIKAVNINIGKYVSSSDIMFEIVNSDKLLLELNLFEKDADKVSIGQKIRFYINNEDEAHEATIYQTGKSISEDKTYKIYADVNASCKNVIPGMYVNALIESESRQSTLVPSEAVVSFEDKDYIFVFANEKMEDGNPFTEYRMISIERGIESDGYIEVILPDGFDINGAKVVTKGAYNLLSAKKNAGEMAC